MLRKRPYLSVEMCGAIIAAPMRREQQEDGRVRFWGAVRLPNEQQRRILRVVTLDDGETVHNAFLDRSFKENER